MGVIWLPIGEAGDYWEYGDLITRAASEPPDDLGGAGKSSAVRIPLTPGIASVARASI